MGKRDVTISFSRSCLTLVIHTCRAWRQQRLTGLQSELLVEVHSKKIKSNFSTEMWTAQSKRFPTVLRTTRTSGGTWEISRGTLNFHKLQIIKVNDYKSPRTSCHGVLELSLFYLGVRVQQKVRNRCSAIDYYFCVIPVTKYMSVWWNTSLRRLLSFFQAEEYFLWNLQCLKQTLRNMAVFCTIDLYWK